MKTFEDKLAEKTPSLVAFVHEAEEDGKGVKFQTEELRAIYGDKVNIVRIDTTFDRHAIKKYDINAYPTWILFKEGQELMRESGEKTINQLTELIERAL